MDLAGDAGLESEEDLPIWKRHQQRCFIKPQNYEKRIFRVRIWWIALYHTISLEIGAFEGFYLLRRSDRLLRRIFGCRKDALNRDTPLKLGLQKRGVIGNVPFPFSALHVPEFPGEAPYADCPCR